MTRATALAAITLSTALAATAAAQELRVGIINTTTTGFAVLGIEMERGWKLGVDELGWKKDGDKLGGVSTHMFYGDDQIRPDVGLREVEKMLKTHKTQVIVGIIGSNVMMGVAKVIFDANVSLIGTNAGPAPIAGEMCNPLFVSTAFMNDQNAEATGELVNRDDIQSVYLVAPNYQAGKDNIAGFQRTYKGQVAGQSLVKLGETDFQAEFSLIRAKAPKAVFVFAPGAMTVAFMRQWETSGLGKEIKLYTLYMIDGTTLPAIGASAIGQVYTNHFNPTLENPRNQAFVKAYVAKHSKIPPFYAMQGYDAAYALARAAQTLGAKIDEPGAIAKTIRAQGLQSVRGDLKYNVNGFLIQPYWKLEVVAGPDGKSMEKGVDKVMERLDSFWEKCPQANRLGTR